MHPPYKAMGARIGFAFWTPVFVFVVVMRRPNHVHRAAIPVVRFWPP